MKAMLSQPMAGKTDEEIVATREKAISALKEKGYEVINTLFTDDWYSKEKMAERGVVQIPLCFLAKSLENMSLCDAAYFCKGWENARGCRIEHEVACTYGLTIIYEEGYNRLNPPMDKIQIHKQLCDNTHSLYEKKNADYGDSFSQLRKRYPNFVCMRLFDKLNRLDTIIQPGYECKVSDEKIEDTLMDIANYALMELTERRADSPVYGSVSPWNLNAYTVTAASCNCTDESRLQQLKTAVYEEGKLNED